MKTRISSDPKVRKVLRLSKLYLPNMIVTSCCLCVQQVCQTKLDIWALLEKNMLVSGPQFFLTHSKNELIQWRGVRRLSVCLSVDFCANRFFSQANGRIATKLSQDGLQVNLHPGCAQGQGKGQRSRDTRTFLDSWNELLRH